MTIFYKGTLESFLDTSFHPQTVTTDIDVAVEHMKRLSNSDACVVEINYNGFLHNYKSYHAEKILGHDDICGYTNEEHTKAMLNTICMYRRLSVEEIAELMNKQMA